MLDALKALAPGTAAFFAAVSGASVVLARWPGRPRVFAAALFVGVSISYLAMSCPTIARWISAGLLQYGQLESTQAAGAARVIIVLTGDSQHARVLETLRLNVLLRPDRVILAGPPLMYRELILGGVAEHRIIVQDGDRTTREQVLNVARIVRSEGLGRGVLVVSAIHMRRALAAARVAGLDVVPSTSATRSMGKSRFSPDYNALRLSRESLYEYVAFQYYRWQGWVDGHLT